MASLLMPIDLLAELSGADFSPDPTSFYNPNMQYVDPNLDPAHMDPAYVEYYVDPVVAAGGPPMDVGMVGYPEGVMEPPVDPALAMPGWAEPPPTPTDYAYEDAFIPPPTTPY